MTPRRLMLLLSLAILGCHPAPSAVPTTAAAPSADPNAVVGTVVDEIAPGTRPTTSSPPASSTPAPGATSAPGGFVPSAVQVTITAPVTTLDVPPPTGLSAIYPTSVQLGVDVLLSNGLHNQNVKWASSNNGLATVSSTGLVAAVGNQSGQAIVTATSADAQASTSVILTITTLGDTQVTVQ